jgi:alanine dehydrogenase
MDLLTLGVIATSAKENEHRLPLHPAQLAGIDEDLRAQIYLERGYGARFGVADAELDGLVAGLRSRDELIAECDIVLLPKPMLSDVAGLRDGQVLWGWPHAVQDPDLTQVSIDKRLTLIAWEEMNRWTDSGQFVVHVFHINNEMAGYASVLHAMTLRGTTGHYGRPLNAVVLGFGNAARGAITALGALGVQDITALTLREVAAVASPMPAAPLKHLYRTEVDSLGTTVQTESGRVSAADFLSGHDIIVNCVLQDTDAPMMFVTEADLTQFTAGTLIVDVSCDAGMGFEFARPTSFADPTFTVGNGITYYAVDHSPSYLWDSATWMISEALTPYLRTVMSGPDAWEADRTVRQAIEIRDGVVQNPRILSFQHRSDAYPHELLVDGA